MNYLDEAQRFIASRPRRRQSVLALFIPAIRLMLDNQLSYKEIFEFVNLHGAACAYPTIVAFTKRYVGVITPARRRIDTPQGDASLRGRQQGKLLANKSEATVDAIGASQAMQRPLAVSASPDPGDLSMKLARSRETADRLIGKSAKELIEQAEKL